MDDNLTDEERAKIASQRTAEAQGRATRHAAAAGLAEKLMETLPVPPAEGS